MKYFPYFFWIMVLGTIGYFGFSAIKDYSDQRKLAADRVSTKMETIYLPRTRGYYGTSDFQIKFDIERRYLSQIGWRWDSPTLRQVNFAVDSTTLEPTPKSPVEDENAIIIKLSVVLHDAIARSYDKDLPRYSPSRQARYPDIGETRYGLSYRPGEPASNGAFNEQYLPLGKPYNLRILCKDNGNPYPDLCYMEVVGESGGGLIQGSKHAIMTDIWFRKERISEWKRVKDQVEKFLDDKIEVVPFYENNSQFR